MRLHLDADLREVMAEEETVTEAGEVDTMAVVEADMAVEEEEGGGTIGAVVEVVVGGGRNHPPGRRRLKELCHSTSGSWSLRCGMSVPLNSTVLAVWRRR